MQTYYVSRAGAVVAIALLVAAGAISIRRARADFDFRRGSPEAVARAVAAAPANVEYLNFRALQLDYDGGDAAPLLERAAELNPLSSAPRIRLGLNAEVRGDFAAAEKWLLDAARVDRQYEPRWTLANFYFRRENAEQFWKWMRAALEVSYGDRRPAFDLCWRMSTDADEIFRRAMPDRGEVLAAYLGWLLGTNRAQAAAPVAIKLSGVAGYRDLLLGADDALLDANDPAAALELWRALGFAAPDGIYRGDFSAPAIAHGFDWRAWPVEGVVHADLDAPRARHRVIFNGRQPESCDLLRQFVLLRRGARYRLSWEASLDQIRSPSGVEWRIGEARAAVANGHGETDFTAASDLAPIRLVYQRPTGETRAEGSIELWGVALRAY